MIKEKLKNIPTRPGCYLFKDEQGQILYVGKASVLRQRVRSYFQSSRPVHPKLSALVARIRDIEWVITDSEVEALIFENNLIKKYKPRYNVDLKDDKSYPYIRITKEDFPRVFITRTLVRDGSEYFGPYTNVKNVRGTLKTLQRIFPLRSCKFDLTPQVIAEKKVQLCLDYYIHKCKGPCQGLQSKEEYNAIIDMVRRFLKGKTQQIVRELQMQMQAHADKLEFEEAARVRNRLEILENYRNAQKVVQIDFKDRDLVSLSREDDDACVVLFKIREGKVIHRMHYFLKGVEWKEDGEILTTFIQRYYANTEDIPQEILLPVKLADATLLSDWLAQRRGAAVKLYTPQRGEKKRLMSMVEKNARYLLEELKLQKLKAGERSSYVVNVLQKDLNLPRTPARIECFDISNIQGSDAVASMVCFVNGKPKKSEYRKFKIRSKDTPDDFAMMREVILRRYSRLQKEQRPLPDLIVVDGGKGQLSSALAALHSLGIKNQPIIGLAKRLEEIFFPGLSDAQMLPKTSASLKLLQQIRDEAHRFAITFHRQRRGKRTLHSELENIPGIGIRRRQHLLKLFGSVKSIRELTAEELAEKGHLPLNVAKNVFDYFHSS